MKEKNQGRTLIFLLVLLLIIGIGVYYLLSKEKANETTGNNTSLEAKESKNTIEQTQETSTNKHNELVEPTSNENYSSKIFKDSSSLEYKLNKNDDENGKIAILKMGESIFKTKMMDGYYQYEDNFGNVYNIKEIVDISSKYEMTGNDDWATLFKCIIEYKDELDNEKSFEAAVIIPKDYDAYIMAPFENYTGSTSFVKDFTDLRKD